MLWDRQLNLNFSLGQYGRTALMKAANEGYTDIARLLLTKGASVNAIDKVDTEHMLCR